ncbi:hypothetical protein H6F67_23670 [Microcoleus sp. FACHB-1515]|uniref:hypothetical protein n=1 Tax=Cyanophyceae TaxID=3028117 RepID=UPI00168575BC|nr:hypothetical protein [Microcoleus sp. FACHB-1515]MBD2092853.1 hypothetical protein [Microcoleus sp. FACHB-1515]
MKLHYFTKPLSTVGRWIANAMLCLAAIVLLWQGALPAMAADNPVDAANDKYQQEAGRSKGFIEDTKDFVQQAARDNAAKVDNATDDDSAIAGKAKRDAARIQKRAEEDADRTQNAVDSARNAVQRTVDSIKDALD